MLGGRWRKKTRLEVNLEKSYEQKHVEAKAKGDVLVMSRILFRSFFPTEMWQEMEFYSSAG